jgi:hypothetical protein
MPIVRRAKSAFDNARRWGALVLLRLARGILSGATDLFRRGRIARAGLRIALAIARFLQRCAGLLLLGLRRLDG